MKDNLDHALTFGLSGFNGSGAEKWFGLHGRPSQGAVRAFIDKRNPHSVGIRLWRGKFVTDKPIAVVTGVGPGTGSAIVRRFAPEDFRVIALARSPDRIRVLEQELQTPMR